MIARRVFERDTKFIDKTALTSNQKHCINDEPSFLVEGDEVIKGEAL